MTATSMFRQMKMERNGPVVDRTYRDGGKHQWVRETAINAIEAGATRIEFGVEWQAAQSKGVYRRIIADNGKGMTPEQLEGFFNTYGGGGKPIGSEHENFGIGAKTSLLPWNHYGMVVVSWVGGCGAMIWINRREDGEYGLRTFRVEDDDGSESIEAAVEPYDDPEHGLDWSRVKPDWIGDHGTVIVLMGRSPDEDTIRGDPGRSEEGLKDIAKYLNHRLWEFGNIHIDVAEFATVKREDWPKSPSRSATFGVMLRRIRGAKHYLLEETRKPDDSTKVESGTVAISGGVEIDWYLHTGTQPQRWHYSPRDGFISVLYRNELYNIQGHHTIYRSFGISEGKVRKTLWLVIRPPEHDKEKKTGVYPKADRNDLLWGQGEPLPFAEWAEEFSDQIPDAIVVALKNARGTSDINTEDNEWSKKLAEQFISQFTIPRFKHDQKGIDRSSKDVSLDISTSDPERTGGRDGDGGGTGPSPAKPPGPGPGPSIKKKPAHSPAGDRAPAKNARAKGSIPRVVVSSDPDTLEAGMLACYTSPNKDEPRGLVTIYREHLVFRSIVERFQNRYPPHQADEVRKIVEDAYGMDAALKVAHSEVMAGLVDRSVVNEMRSPRSLTMALLGLWVGEQAVLSLLQAKLGSRGKLRAA
jgi:hypothetical protein